MNRFNYRIFSFFICYSMSCLCFCQSFYEEGLKQYNSDDNLKAIDFFTKSIDLNQNVSNSYAMRAAAKIMLNNLPEAIADLEKSMELDSNNYKTHLYYGKVYMCQGLYYKAQRYYDQACLMNTKAGEVYHHKAMVNTLLRNYRLAIDNENIAIMLDSATPEFYHNRGYARLQLLQYDSAIQDFNRALIFKEIPQSYASRGVALAAMGLHEMAIGDFTLAIRKLPIAKDLPYHRGISYKALGKKELACQDFKRSESMGYYRAISELKTYCLSD